MVVLVMVIYCNSGSNMFAADSFTYIYVVQFDNIYPSHLFQFSLNLSYICPTVLFPLLPQSIS